MNVIQLTKSFKYAMRGIAYVFAHEQNFRVQLVSSFIVLLIMVWLPLSKGEIVTLLLLITMVLVLELLNSVLEKFVDIIKPRLSYQVEVIKDMMAAMVLIASVFAAVIGLIILGPHLFEAIGY